MVKTDNFWMTTQYALLTKREVKIAGYWPPSSCLGNIFMDREVEVNQNVEMTEANINIHASHLERTSAVKPTLLKDNFFLRDQPMTEIARVANQITGFASSCPLADSAMYLKKFAYCNARIIRLKPSNLDNSCKVSFFRISSVRYKTTSKDRFILPNSAKLRSFTRIHRNQMEIILYGCRINLRVFRS